MRIEQSMPARKAIRLGWMKPRIERAIKQVQALPPPVKTQQPVPPVEPDNGQS